jgi:murein DD-endopeptidase MepM/ murein hydrolase activator NlpD
MNKFIAIFTITALTLAEFTVSAQEKGKKKMQDDFEQYKKKDARDFQDFKSKQEAELKRMKDEYQDYYNEMMGLKKYYTDKKDTSKLNVVDGIISYEKSINDALGEPLNVTENIKFDPGKNNEPEKHGKAKKVEQNADIPEVKNPENKSPENVPSQTPGPVQPGISAIIPSLTPLLKSNAVITSPFGMRIHPILKVPMKHNGIDFNSKTGTEIFAAADGKVLFRKTNVTSGNYLVIEHANSQSTAYLHLSQFAVSAGDHVTKGQLIGYVGNTGRSTGPHLHYEVRTKGIPVDPKSFLLEYK